MAAIAYSPDGHTLVSGSNDNTVRLWDVNTAKSIATLMKHTGQVTSVAYSPNGRTLTSGSTDGTVHLWDIDTGKLLLGSQGILIG